MWRTCARRKEREKSKYFGLFVKSGRRFQEESLQILAALQVFTTQPFGGMTPRPCVASSQSSCCGHFAGSPLLIMWRIRVNRDDERVPLRTRNFQPRWRKEPGTASAAVCEGGVFARDGAPPRLYKFPCCAFAHLRFFRRQAEDRVARSC